MNNLRVIPRSHPIPAMPLRRVVPVIMRPVKTVAPKHIINVQSRTKPHVASPNRPVIKMTRTVVHPKPNNPLPILRTPQKVRVIPSNRPIAVNKESHIQTLLNVGTGRTLIIIAAGPSVNEVDFTPIKDNPKIDFMCINKPYASIWPSKYWSFCDHSQYERNKEYWHSYQGTVINSINVTARRQNQVIFPTRHGQGFSIGNGLISGYYVGNSTTYASLQVALYMNFDKIYVFGMDMAQVNGQLHHYGQNPDVDNERRMKRFKGEAQHFLWAGTHLKKEERNKIFFCSSYNPHGFLEHFTKIDHKLAVDIIKSSTF